MQARISEEQKIDPVILAAKNGQIDHLKVLIAEKADLNKQDNDGYSALMWAVGNIKLDCAELLIQAKASLELEDNEGNTVLSLAAIASTQGCIDALGILLPAGANINHKNKENQTIIDIAIDYRTRIIDVMALLLNENVVPSYAVKMLAYLQAQDKSKLITYICYHLFHQQQENLRLANVSNATVLSDENFQILTNEIDMLPKPPKNETVHKINLVKSTLDTALTLPTVLIDLLAQYDDPYQRFGIFKYQKAVGLRESKIEQVALAPQLK